METRRNERNPTHSFAPCGANQLKSGATAKETSNGAGVKKHGVTEKARVGNATSPAQPTPAVSYSVFRLLSLSDNAVSGSAGLAPNTADGIVLPLEMFRHTTAMPSRRACLKFH